VIDFHLRERVDSLWVKVIAVPAQLQTPELSASEISKDFSGICNHHVNTNIMRSYNYIHLVDGALMSYGNQ
jgi:hypothetical protein